MKNDVTGGMELKISSALKIIKESNGTIPVVFCAVAHNSFQQICVEGCFDTIDECTVIQQQLFLLI